MKKLLASIVALAIFFVPFPMTEILAEGALSRIQAATVPANAGKDVEVAVDLTDNEGIIAIGFTVGYDTNALELVRVEDRGLFADAAFAAGGDVTAVPYHVTWDAALAADDYTDTGTIAVLHFHVLDTAAIGLSEISINIDEHNTFNVNMDNVSFSAVNGGVEIKEKGDETTNTETSATTTEMTTTENNTTTEASTTTTQTSTTTTKTTTTTTKTTTTTTKTTTTTTQTTTTTAGQALSRIQAATVSANAGEDVEVAVDLTDNEGIIAIGFTVGYDTNALELVRVEDRGLFADAAFAAGGDVTAVPYHVTWDAALAADDYTDTGTIAVLHFHVLDTAAIGLSEISINIDEHNTFNVNMDNVSFSAVNGGVEIKEKGDETTITISHYTYTVETKSPQFYFSHDTEEFKPEDLIKSITRYAVNSDGSVSESGDVLPNLEIVSFDGATPESLYTEDEYEYVLSASITDEFGSQIVTSAGKAYIGVKGDANLDGAVDAKDAAEILVYAATIGSGKTAYIYSETDEMMENFVLWLADIDSSDKADAKDAASILIYAAEIGSGKEITWEELLGTA